ncbi:MAG: hypothetical protein WCF65_08355 [Parachlamydiaceae bacterium]
MDRGEHTSGVLLTALLRAGGEYIVGHMHYALALDDSLKGFDNNSLYDNNFEPELKVIVGAHYTKTPLAMTSSDVVHVVGRITVSF